MNLSKVDLNLFIVFDAIYTEANLTRAGQIVGITQPAVSNALSRLRETFNDPLFVRTAQAWCPRPWRRTSSARCATPGAAAHLSTGKPHFQPATGQQNLPYQHDRPDRSGHSAACSSGCAPARGADRVSCASAVKPPRSWPQAAWIRHRRAVEHRPQVRHVKLMQDRYVVPCAKATRWRTAN